MPSHLLWVNITLKLFGTISSIWNWCGFEFVNVEWTTVEYFYVGRIITTATRITETHLPRDNPLVNRRMVLAQISDIVCVAIVITGRNTIGVHACSRHKPIPAFGDIVVIFVIVTSRVTIISWVIIDCPMVNAFCFIAYKNKVKEKKNYS